MLKYIEELIRHEGAERQFLNQIILEDQPNSVVLGVFEVVCVSYKAGLILTQKEKVRRNALCCQDSAL